MKCVLCIKESYSKEEKVKIFTFAYSQAGSGAPHLTVSLTVKFAFFYAFPKSLIFVFWTMKFDMIWPVQCMGVILIFSGVHLRQSCSLLLLPSTYDWMDLHRHIQTFVPDEGIPPSPPARPGRRGTSRQPPNTFCKLQQKENFIPAVFLVN